MSEHFKVPRGHLVFRLYLQTLSGLLFASTSTTIFGSFGVKQLQLIIFEKHPGKRAFFMKGAPSQVTNWQYLLTGDFQKTKLGQVVKMRGDRDL